MDCTKSQDATKEKLDNDRFVCYQHDDQQPTKKVVATECSIYQNFFDTLEGKLVCEFDLNSGKFAWVDELNQHLSGESTYTKNELVKSKS